MSIGACAAACILIFVALWVAYIAYGLEMSIVAAATMAGLLWLWMITVVVPFGILFGTIRIDDDPR